MDGHFALTMNDLLLARRSSLLLWFWLRFLIVCTRRRKQHTRKNWWQNRTTNEGTKGLNGASLHNVAPWRKYSVDPHLKHTDSAAGALVAFGLGLAEK